MSHCTLHCAWCTLTTTHYTLYTMHYTLCTIHYALYTMQCTLHSEHYRVHTIHYTLYTLYFTLQTSHYTPYTLYYTLHSAHYEEAWCVMWVSHWFVDAWFISPLTLRIFNGANIIKAQLDKNFFKKLLIFILLENYPAITNHVCFQGVGELFNWTNCFC